MIRTPPRPTRTATPVPYTTPFRSLRDGEQRDTGAPCRTCEVPLVRVWGSDEQGDGWKCPRCHTRSTETQYRFAVAHLHREEATHLTEDRKSTRLNSSH